MLLILANIITISITLILYLKLYTNTATTDSTTIYKENIHTCHINIKTQYSHPLHNPTAVPSTKIQNDKVRDYITFNTTQRVNT
jgi:hypothetical protein